MCAKEKEKDPMMAVLANIEKRMGRKKDSPSPFARFGTIENVKIPVIPFGLKDIDDASYCGGIPRGKMVEIFGEESSGKSLLTLFLIAQAQKQGLECALIDVEQSFDPLWAKKQGVNVDRLVYSNTFEGAGEEALEYASKICESGAFGLVVIDSTAALTPLAEIEGSLQENARVGAQAQMMSRGCRKICAACGATNTTCIFINQVRMKIGVMYGNPETTPGGKALPFYSHVRIRTRKSSRIKVKDGEKDKIVGQVSVATFIKNKVARPWGEAEFKIIYDSASLNPVVMLANALKTAKIVTTYNGILRLGKEVASEVFNEKKPIETGATNFVELADWMIKEKCVIKLLDYLLEDQDNLPKEDKQDLDGSILEMKTDSSKIVSPTNNVIISTKLLGETPNTERTTEDDGAPEEE